MGAERPVRVVIVSYDTRDELRRCLAALGGGGAPDLDIVVVDNASSDGSADMVRTGCRAVRLETPGTNLGFAGGVNLGLRDAPGPYALVLNPDVEIAPDVVREMVAFLDRTPDAAAVSPLLVGDDDTPQQHLYRRFPTPAQILLFWTVLSVVAGRVRRLRERLLEHRITGHAPVPVDQLPGAAILMRVAALESVGSWDPGYFIWWEDVDWCYRARRAGWSLSVLPGLRVRHAGAASFRGWGVQTRVFQFYRAFYRFLCKHRLDRLRRIATPVLLADLRLKGAILALRRLVRLPHPDGVASLSPTRRAIRAVTERCRRGQLPEFTDARPDAGPTMTRRASVTDDDRETLPAVDAVIVSWKARRYLPECLRALSESQPPPRVIVVDNDSRDGTADFLRRHHPDVKLVEMGRNAGYAVGANAGIAAGTAEHVFVMNPDVRVAPSHLARLVAAMADDPDLGMAQGRLLSVSPEDFLAGRAPDEPRLDSAGVLLGRTRMAYDRGQGERDAPEWRRPASPFAASGAAVLIRRAMIHDVAPDGRLFDPAFFAYKEDVDASWRARLFGWGVRYVPDAEAWHIRTLPLDARLARRVPAAARRHSWMNHWLMMLKNDRTGDIVRDLPWILGWEVLRLGHATLRDPALLPAYLGVWARVPGALRERRFIQAARRARGPEIRSWITAPPTAARPPAVAT